MPRAQPRRSTRQARANTNSGPLCLVHSQGDLHFTPGPVQIEDRCASCTAKTVYTSGLGLYSHGRLHFRPGSIQPWPSTLQAWAYANRGPINLVNYYIFLQYFTSKDTLLTMNSEYRYN